MASIVAGRPPGPIPGGAAGDRTLELLARHGLVGLAVAEARARGDDVPWLDPDFEPGASMKRVHLETALHSTLVSEAAARAREALEVVGIPSVLFKGAALLADGTYPDPGARAMDDVDLLVAPGSVAAAVEALEACGFEPWVPWEAGRLHWLPAFTFTDKHAPAGLGISLDLHWRTPYNRFRSGQETGSFSLFDSADTERGVPAAEPHLLLIAEHFLKHVRVLIHLRGMADIVRLLPPVEDPGRLAAIADARGSRRALGTVLAALRDSFGVKLPRGLTDSVWVPDRSAVGAGVLTATSVVGEREGASTSRFGGLLIQWSIAGSVGSMLEDAVDVLLPPGDWLAQRYPDVSGSLGRRMRHVGRVGAWLLGRRPSPLSPNQEFET